MEERHRQVTKDAWPEGRERRRRERRRPVPAGGSEGGDARRDTSEPRGRVVELLRFGSLARRTTPAAALEAWCWGHRRADVLDERLAMISAAVRLADDLGDDELALRARRARLHEHLERGERAAAGREIDAIVRGLGSETAIRPEPAWLHAMWSLLEGRFSDAERHTLEARRAKGTQCSVLAGHQYVAQLFALRRDQGRLGEIDTVVREHAARHERVSAWRAVLALVAAHMGRMTEARSELGHLVGESGVRIPVDAAWLPATALVAEVCHRLDAPAAAAPLYAELLPWSRRHVVVAPATAYLGPVDHYLGLLATTASNFDAAQAHFELALDQVARLGARPSLARTQVALAACAVRRGGPGDATRARSLLADARLLAGELGMGELSREARLLAAVARFRAPGAGARVGLRRPAGSVERSFAVRCFGGFELWVEGRPLQLRALKPKARSALRLLAMHAGRPVHREKIMDALWRDRAPAAATRSLQVVVSSLRQTLEPGVARGASSLLVREGEAYRLAVPSDGDCDVLRFERCVEEARSARVRGDANAAAVALDAALDAYAGDLLPEEGPADWVVKDRERYRAAAADAAHALAELLLEGDEPVAAAAACERGLRIDHYRDELWRTLLRALVDAGNHVAARRAQRGYDEMLAELDLA